MWIWVFLIEDAKLARHTPTGDQNKAYKEFNKDIHKIPEKHGKDPINNREFVLGARKFLMEQGYS